MILIPTGISTSFFPIPALRRDFYLCLGMGMGRLERPSPSCTTQTSNLGLLAGDLNNDKKLDFITSDAVFLGNGDGTFKQIPLTIPNNQAVVAIADLNGDGILDVVSGSLNLPGSGSTIYAGKGDGTFATTALLLHNIAA